MLYAQFRGTGANRLLVLMLAAMLSLAACGGGGGGSSDSNTDSDNTSDAPTGDTDISASELEGTWSGSIEPYQSGSVSGKFGTLSVKFDANGDMTQVDLDGATTNMTGTQEGKPTDSSQIFQYTLDGDTLFLWVNADVNHAGIVFEDGSMGVIQKGATEGSYGNADAVVGEWSGASVYLINDGGLKEDGFDDVDASYADNSGTLESTDLSFTDPDGENQDCLNLTHTLTGYDGSYGVHDTADATGGDGDCPGTDVVPADAYVSPDADFMMILAGCEAGDEGNGVLHECSVAVLNRQTP